MSPTAAELLARVVAARPNGGEDRPGQILMAEAVARALESGEHLLVEAPTGIGKSLAYLVPGALRGLMGEKLVVVTATNGKCAKMTGWLPNRSP